MPQFKLLILFFIFSLILSRAAIGQEFSTSVRYLHVQQGQTLHNIVKRLYPQQPDQWQKLSGSIVRLNPHAFVDNDPAQMKAGVRLELPGKVVMRSETLKPQGRKQVGTVTESSGSVVAVDPRQVSRRLVAADPVYLGDKVITGEDGFVRLRMVDQALLDLRCFSIMVIEEYALNKASSRSILNLLQGSLKKVTGEIGKLTDDIYQLKTPVASVGVRGTEYALRVFQAKGCGGTIDADDGLYLEVIKGLVDVHNVAGKAVVARGETAYVALPQTAPEKAVLQPGVLSPVEEAPAVEDVIEVIEVNDPVVTIPPAEPVEESSSIWWWLLGIVGIILLI